MKAIEDLEKDLSPEIAAIILVCRFFLKTANVEELKEFFEKKKIDWLLFNKIVRSHNIRPIVYSVISNFNLPEEAIGRLQADCKQIALKNFEQYRELLKLNNLFKQANITCIPYKGCLYGLQFYNDISLRESSDIDYLINADIEDIKLITELLFAEGYINGIEIPEKFREYYFHHNREFKFFLFTNGKRKFLVEFHSSLNDPVFETQSPIPNEYLFVDLTDEIFNGNKITTLSPTKHLISIITHHGIAGQWASLKNIMDVAQVLKNDNNVNWDELFDCSNTYRFNKVLNIGLSIANDILGVSPAFQFKKVKNISPWLKRLFTNHLYPIDRTWKNNLPLKLRSKDNIVDSTKMIYKHIRHLATPSILDFNFIQLPRPLFFLYIFIKPIRMLKRK
jgi:hypothetical protein